jgi:hypothetical protein
MNTKEEEEEEEEEEIEKVRAFNHQPTHRRQVAQSKWLTCGFSRRRHQRRNLIFSFHATKTDHSPVRLSKPAACGFCERQTDRQPFHVRMCDSQTQPSAFDPRAGVCSSSACISVFPRDKARFDWTFSPTRACLASSFFRHSQLMCRAAPAKEADTQATSVPSILCCSCCRKNRGTQSSARWSLLREKRKAPKRLRPGCC